MLSASDVLLPTAVASVIAVAPEISLLLVSFCVSAVFAAEGDCAGIVAAECVMVKPE